MADCRLKSRQLWKRELTQPKVGCSKRKKENEEKRDKPEPDKRFKFFNPVTGQEHEGTAASARQAMCNAQSACLRDDGDDVVAV